MLYSAFPWMKIIGKNLSRTVTKVDTPREKMDEL